MKTNQNPLKKPGREPGELQGAGPPRFVSVDALILPRPPILRFSPTAWAKLQFFGARGESEIGGFGIASADDLLKIEEFSTVIQEVSCASVAFSDEAVADFFEAQVDAGKKPEQFARVWLHTHPGTSARPSSTDEATFYRVFGRCDWAVMFILSEGQSYARLRFNTGPGGELKIPVEIDFNSPFAASDYDAWEAEYIANIAGGSFFQPWSGEERFSNPNQKNRYARRRQDMWQEELMAMNACQRQKFLHESADWPEI